MTRQDSRPSAAAANGDHFVATQPGTASAERPPRSIVEIMLHRKWTVIFWVLVGLGLGAVYQHYAPTKYQSRAEIAVLRANPEAPPSPLSSAGLSASAPTTHAALIKSNPVLTSALADPAVADAAFLDGVDDPVRFLLRELKVTASDEKETVSIRFEAGDPNEAAALIVAVVKAYFEQQGLPVRGMSPVEGDPLTVSVMDEQVIASRMLMQAEELTRAKVHADLALSRYERARSAGRDVNMLQQLLGEAGADTDTLGLQSLSAMSSELLRLDQVIQSMPPSWGPEHSRRAPVQQQYEALTERYYLAQEAVVAQSLAMLEGAYTHAAGHRDRLEAELATLHAQAELARTQPVRVIDPPRVASKPSSPLALRTFGVAGLIGLLLGGCFAIRAELRHPPASSHKQHAQPPPAEDRWEVASVAKPVLLHGRDDLERVETVRELPLLGTVPPLSTGRRLTSPNFTSTASSIHQVRAVLQVQAHSKGTKSYAFTSPHRGAGKTSVTIGVASSLAISGTRTLVVDCDLAGRIVRGQTGRPADPGHISPFGPIDRQGSSPHNESLDDIAVGQGYLDKDGREIAHVPKQKRVGVVGMLEGRALADCAVKATVDGLWLLPAAGAETRHIGMMSDQFIRDLLEQARDEFDLILFDTGPVPGSVEALLVTSQADGVVVVVSHGESGAALDRTMSYLSVVNATIIGTVFNHAKPRAADAPAGGTHTNGHAQAERPPEGPDTGSGSIGKDIDDAMGEVPLGSGILAAAVFADEGTGFDSDAWQLRGTSEDSGVTDSPDDQHRSPTNGSVNGNSSGAHKPGTNGAPSDPLYGDVSDILPPE